MKKNNIMITVLVMLLSAVLGLLLGLSYKAIKSKTESDNCSKSLIEFQENNKQTVFSVDKITYFSSCNANIETNSNSSFTISDLFQYTDIAISITPNPEVTDVLKSTLKSVELSEVSFPELPSEGTPKLYYKSINDFATSKYEKENLIDNTFNFDTTAESKIDYTKPVLYNNCANPITLCYVNEKIMDSYTLSNSVSNIAHNGTLLKTCGVTLNSLNCKLNFVVTITNNLDEKYVCPFSLNIPISTESNTIYDGSLRLDDATDYKFMQIN